MEDAEHDEVVFFVVDLVDDDVGQALNDPFIGAGHSADVADIRKFREPVGGGEDSLDDMRCRNGTASLYVEVNAGNVCERFNREAQFHNPDFFFSADTSALVARRVVASRSARRMRCTSAT